MKRKNDLIVVRIESEIRKQFQIHCEENETTMSQELRRCIKQLLGTIKHASPMKSSSTS